MFDVPILYNLMLERSTGLLILANLIMVGVLGAGQIFLLSTVDLSVILFSVIVGEA